MLSKLHKQIPTNTSSFALQTIERINTVETIYNENTNSSNQASQSNNISRHDIQTKTKKHQELTLTTDKTYYLTNNDSIDEIVHKTKIGGITTINRYVDMSNNLTYDVL